MTSHMSKKVIYDCVGNTISIEDIVDVVVSKHWLESYRDLMLNALSTSCWQNACDNGGVSIKSDSICSSIAISFIKILYFGHKLNHNDSPNTSAIVDRLKEQLDNLSYRN